MTTKHKVLYKEIQDIMRMCRTLTQSYELLSDKSGIHFEFIKFDGFDNNNEDEYLKCAYELERQGLSHGWRVYDSHFPRLPAYRIMLGRFNNLRHNAELTREDIIGVISQ